MMSPPRYFSRYFIQAIIIALAATSPPSHYVSKGLFANQSLLIWWYSLSWSIDFQLSIRLSSSDKQYISLNPGLNFTSHIKFLPSPKFFIKGQVQKPYISSQSVIPFSSRFKYFRFFHCFGSITYFDVIYEHWFLHKCSSSTKGRAGANTSI